MPDTATAPNPFDAVGSPAPSPTPTATAAPPKGANPFDAVDHPTPTPRAPLPTPTASPFANPPTPLPAATAPPPTAAPKPQPTAGTRPDDKTQQYTGKIPRPTPLDELFAIGDAPFFLYSGARRALNSSDGAQEQVRVLTAMSQGKWPELAARYNLMSPEQLKFESDHGDHLAGWFYDQPFAAGITQGLAELVNPVADATGGVVGKGIAGGAKLTGAAIRKIPAVARAIEAMGPRARQTAILITNAMSPFRDVALAGGEKAKAWTMSIAQRVASDPAHAQAKALEIFNGLSPQEQQDVVHVFQGGLLEAVPLKGRAAMKPGDKAAVEGDPQPEAAFGRQTTKAGQAQAEALSRAAIRTTDVTRLGEIYHRAYLLADYIQSLSQQKVGAGLLDEGVSDVRERFFPMRGAFEHPVKSADEEFAETWHEGGAGKSRTLGPDTERKEAQYSTLAEAQKHGRVPIKDDFSPAVQLEKWATSSLQRLDLEDALSRAPSSLVRAAKPSGFTKVGRREGLAGGSGQHVEPYYEDDPAKAPRDAAGRPMATWDTVVAKYPELRGLDSPTLKKSYVSDAFAAWLSKNRTRLYSDRELYGRKTDPWTKLGNKGLAAFDGLNDVQRKAILANPIVHPVFNLANNAAAAGVPLHDVAMLATKSVINAMGGGKLLAKFMPRAEEYARWVDEAQRAGALAEMRTGDTRLLAARYQDLSPFQKAAKLGDEINAWHNRVTFGPHGEEAFSVALYRRLKQSGRFGSDEEVGKAVREALGNYQNVAHDGWGVDQIASRAIFFYPWLKGNLPFWVRQLTTARGYKLAAAPHQAARANNALVGDPSETQGKSPSAAGDFVFTGGGLHGVPNDPKRGFSADVPLLPQRMLSDAAGFGAAAFAGDPGKAVAEATKIVRSRLQPMARLGMDVAATYDPGRYPDSPLDPQAFDTVADRRAPLAVQRKELGRAIAAELLPIPIIGYEIQDGLRRGLTSDAVRQEIVERGAAGFSGQFIYDRLTPAQKGNLGKLGERFTSAASKITKNPNVSDEEKQNRLTRVYNGYADAVRRILGEPAGADEPLPYPTQRP